MAIMKKGNCEKVVDEDKVNEFIELGYSLLDEKGEVIKFGEPQSKDDFRTENKELKVQNEELKVQNEELKVQNEELKKQNDEYAAEIEKLNKQIEELNSALKKGEKKKTNKEQ